jgi:hypothetical protein
MRVSLGCPSEHKGYQCLDLASNRLITWHHVTFDEASFPFTEIFAPPSSTFDFLFDMDCVPLPIGPSSFTGAPPSFGVAALVGLSPQAAVGSTKAPVHSGATPASSTSLVIASTPLRLPSVLPHLAPRRWSLLSTPVHPPS